MEFTGFYKKQSMYVFFWNKESMKCNLLPMFFEGFWEPSWYIAEIFLKKPPEEFPKRAILKISQNSDESTCVVVSILINLHASGLQLYKNKRLRHKYFPVSSAKFLRTPFFQNTSEQLFLNFTNENKASVNEISYRWFYHFEVSYTNHIAE